MQTPQPAPVIAPAQAPRAPVSITMVGPDGKTQTLTIPRTEAEVEQLQAQREELSNQLSNVSERRQELAQEVRSTDDPVTRSGLEERLRLLDQRILQIETDLAMTGRQISSAPADLIASTEINTQPGGDDHFEDGLAVGGVSVLFLIAIVLFLTRHRRRRSGADVPAGLGSESAQRLERLEHGMEAIAIEIERVSEGQRFVTRLLSESQQPLSASGLPRSLPPNV
jgi:hypothetical protein